MHFFNSNKVCVSDLDTQKVVSKGPRHKSLYVLENQEFATLYSNRQCSIPEDMEFSVGTLKFEDSLTTKEQ